MNIRWIYRRLGAILGAAFERTHEPCVPTRRFGRLGMLMMGIAVVLAVGMASCSGDLEGPDSTMSGEPVGVGFILSADNLTDRLTRGDNFSEGELTEGQTQTNELIMDWIVVVFRNNTVIAVAENDAAVTQSGVWNDRVNVELPKGVYTAMAFANMDHEAIKAALPLGKELTDEDWKDFVINKSTEDLLAEGKIPMSGYLENFTVKGTVNEDFAIELVRMLCKVEFTFKNLSQETISINEISLNPVYDDNIYCFADYDKKPEPDMEPEYEPRFPTVTDGLTHYDAFTRNLTGYSLPSSAAGTGEGETKRTHFYIKESIAEGNHPTDHFHIGMKMTRGATTEDVSYALAADELKYFYRNDYVLFPIVISDYVPEFEVRDYPPIGGYPVSVTSQGTEFYATFSSSGSFAIKARLRDSKGNTVAVKAYSASNAQDSYVKYIPSGDETFKLTYDAGDEVWRGNYDVRTDASKHIVLKFEFFIKNAGSVGGGLTYTRSLHLISA